MTDESASETLSEAEYAALDAALRASARGRLFLAEVVRRSRNDELGIVLAAVERLGRQPPREDGTAAIMRGGLSDLLGAIERAAVQMAALEGRDGVRPLGHRLRDQHEATSSVLDAAERIQEAAWTLREQGVDGTVCDFLDERATEIYAACGRQENEARQSAIALAAYEFVVERIGDVGRACDLRISTSGGLTPSGGMQIAASGPASFAASTSLVSDDVAFVVPETIGSPPLPDLAAASEKVSVAEAFADIDRLPTRDKLALFS